MDVLSVYALVAADPDGAVSHALQPVPSRAICAGRARAPVFKDPEGRCNRAGGAERGAPAHPAGAESQLDRLGEVHDLVACKNPSQGSGHKTDKPMSAL